MKYDDIPAPQEDIAALRAIIAATKDPFLKAFHRRVLDAKLAANRKLVR
jgi:hypothetical protein